MDWMKLAVQLTREAMKTDEPAQPPPQPVDFGAALARQFELIDRNLDAVVTTVNAHHKKLEDTIRRQRIWNILLAAGLFAALIMGLLRFQ